MICLVCGGYVTGNNKICDECAEEYGDFVVVDKMSIRETKRNKVFHPKNNRYFQALEKIVEEDFK